MGGKHNMRQKLYNHEKYIDKFNKADQAFWMKDLILIALVLGLSTVDAVNLYAVFSNLTFEIPQVTILMTLGCAITLNFIPLIMARFIHYYRYGMNGVKLWMILSMAAVFLVLFCATFYLRWETRGMNFEGAEATLMDTTGQVSGIDGMDENDGSNVALTIMLGILPFVTSAINLALGYFNDDPVRRSMDKLKVERQKFLKHYSILLAAEKELNQDWKNRLTELDSQRLMQMNAQVESTASYLKKMARIKLAEKLKDADSISYLTEDKIED